MEKQEGVKIEAQKIDNVSDAGITGVQGSGNTIVNTVNKNGRETSDDESTPVEKKNVKEPCCRNIWNLIVKEKKMWMWIILIVLILVDINCHISYKHMFESESVVLTFVGILATFVVVGNYFQVKDIERKADEKLRLLELGITEKLNVQKQESERLIKRSVNEASCLNQLRLLSSYSSKDPNVNIKRLHFAIQDYVNTGCSRPDVINQIVEEADWLYMIDEFSMASLPALQSFLKDIVPLRGHHERIESLEADVWQVFSEKKRKSELAEKK
jgi:hypothetical protein